MAEHTVPCIDCGAQTSPRAIGTYHEAAGFIEYRGKTGGANNLKWKSYTGRIICPECSSMRRQGIASGQQGLF